MLNDTAKMIEAVQKFIDQGILTPTKVIDLETFVCFTESTPQGSIYHQYPFESMPKDFQDLFLGRRTGEEFGRFKIVATFDVWPLEPVSRRVVSN